MLRSFTFSFFARFAIFVRLMKPKRVQRSFIFIKNVKECKDRSVILQKTEKNAKIVPFFNKERKRTQRSFHSLEKNGKEHKDCSVLL